MVEVGEAQGTELYLSRFAELEERWGKNGRSWHWALRKEAIGRFGELGFPSIRQEQWKYTNVGPIKRVPFRPAGADRASPIERKALDPFAFDATRLVFVNGRFDDELSTLSDALEGVEIRSLRKALGDEGAPEKAGGILQAHLSQHLEGFEEHPFAALNSALFEDGAFVHVPRGRVVPEPVHVLFVTTESAQPVATFPRVLVVLEENAGLTLIEDYASLGGGARFTNSLTEISVGGNACLDHYRFVRERDGTFHTSATAARQSASSVFTSHSITLGGSLVRNDVHALLDGEGCECTLNGLVVGAGEQHIDNQTRIVHAKPQSRSWEIYKAILDDKATGVFNGKIYVHPQAQKTDAKQTNNALLLSDDAAMNSKPELEIYADDVKCTHGATVGQLDKNSLFYMRTRGIPEERARNILIFAFSSEVVEQIRVERLREAVEDLLHRKLPQERFFEYGRMKP